MMYLFFHLSRFQECSCKYFPSPSTHSAKRLQIRLSPESISFSLPMSRQSGCKDKLYLRGSGVRADLNCDRFCCTWLHNLYVSPKRAAARLNPSLLSEIQPATELPVSQYSAFFGSKTSDVIRYVQSWPLWTQESCSLFQRTNATPSAPTW